MAATTAILQEMYARRLSRAIVKMADRYAQSDRDAAYAYMSHLRAHAAGNVDFAAEAKAEHERNNRAAMRRRDALGRLTDALERMATT